MDARLLLLELNTPSSLSALPALDLIAILRVVPRPYSN